MRSRATCALVVWRQFAGKRVWGGTELLLTDVLLLASVPSTDERNRERDWGELSRVEEVGEGEGDRVRDEPGVRETSACIQSQRRATTDPETSSSQASASR